MKRCGSTRHRALAIETLHADFLVRQSASHWSL
jgi:hypothetical protein